MKLSELLQSIDAAEIRNPADPEIRSLCHDSRKAEPGALFFALKGVVADGHRFLNAAVSNGAAAVVVEDFDPVPTGIPAVKVADARLAMARIAAAFHGDPTASLPLVGITGTNGKTTTTYLIEAIMAAAGLPPAVLGTISYRFGQTVFEASHTTPESTELQQALRTLADRGARGFVMEVSSHALEQKRVDGCHFDVGIFSNLTRDHLDYHGSMEQYLEAKMRLFSELLSSDEVKPRRRAVINLDDPSGASIAERSVCPVITFAVGEQADVRPLNFRSTVNGISALLQTPAGELAIVSRLVGRFNLANILAAVSAGIALELPLDAIRTGIEGHATVPGRMERVDNGRGVTCLVDYAHTGDALANVLSTIKEIATGRIITVFGCGGDRDSGKRPIMGRIAAEMSDLAIITSDNPRTEEPLRILEQIRAGIVVPDLAGTVREYTADELSAGFDAKGFTTVADRREAIRLAARVARPGDLLLLAGKGHEDYQIIGTTKHHFDDREEAARAFAELVG
ncbi:MAG TPA: UDP-N-acetylmuramoyl-L-alanyl-D-glutamate--2,6-diaminopimelate ligase [Geobacteraceae bacterium]|nr:UDP-N-acetylmuramoyl-L-alanyl-D-glutamate--2,6-diaminopimelate ligase [Geobacteraceae bacterium]